MLIPYSHLRLGSSKWSLSFRLSLSNPLRLSLLSHACHKPRPPHPPCLDLPNDIWGRVQFMKLLTVQLPPFSLICSEDYELRNFSVCDFMFKRKQIFRDEGRYSSWFVSVSCGSRRTATSALLSDLAQFCLSARGFTALTAFVVTEVNFFLNTLQPCQYSLTETERLRSWVTQYVGPNAVNPRLIQIKPQSCRLILQEHMRYLDILISRCCYLK
jgi:hypothetical protein